MNDVPFPELYTIQYKYKNMRKSLVVRPYRPTEHKDGLRWYKKVLKHLILPKRRLRWLKTVLYLYILIHLCISGGGGKQPVCDIDYTQFRSHVRTEVTECMKALTAPVPAE